jgi:cell division protein FtsL
MENVGQNNKTVTYGLSALAALLLIGGVYFWNKSGELTRQNDLIEQRADSLLSVKLQLEGDIRGLNSQIETTSDEKNSLDKRVEDLNTQLTNRDRAVTQLRQSNLGRTRTIQGLNRNIATMTTKRDSLESQMEAVQNKITWLTDANTKLTSQNDELSPLKQQVADLRADLQTKVPRTALTGDAFRIETVKGNEKETAKAKKVNTLMVSLSVPAEMGLTGTQEVYLSLTDEQNNGDIVPMQNSSTITLSGKNEVVPVHATQSVNFDKNPQRISFSVSPGSPIKPGIYRASVYTKNAYLGTAEFRLRDSFWFF